MNFAVCEIPVLSGAVLIGLVDIFHVFVSDLAEGGGLSLSWTEWNA